MNPTSAKSHLSSEVAHLLSSTSTILTTLIITAITITLKIVMDSLSALKIFQNIFKCLPITSTLHLPSAAISAISAATLVIFFAHRISSSAEADVFLLDFSCYRPPDFCRVPLSTFIEHFNICPGFSEDSILFQTRVLQRSGLGNHTSLPAATHELPPGRSLPLTLSDVETIIFATVHELLLSSHRTVDPSEIDILITSCGMFCPTPSLAASIINRFGLRSDIRSFHLAGMGCSVSLKSIALARDLLRVHKNSRALIVTVETTIGGYQGKEKSMLMANCLFRTGGVAIVLSNRRQDGKRARYLLEHAVCKNLASDEASFNSIRLDIDKEGYEGVRLSKSILQVASDALRSNIRSLAPKVLPWTELLRFGFSALLGRLYGRPISGQTPDFRKAFEHFCIHAGGKGVIDAIAEALRLGDEDVEASKMTLHRFGNTSSSTVWYSLSYLEAKGRMNKGDRVLQIGFGSGFKCNSTVWKCISEGRPAGESAWSDWIHQDPMEVAEEMQH